jgi:hypothetical protein
VSTGQKFRDDLVNAPLVEYALREQEVPAALQIHFLYKIMRSRIFMALLGLVIVGSGLSVVHGQDATRKNEKGSKMISTSFDKKKGARVVKMRRSTITRIAQEKDTAPNFPLHQMDFEMSLAQKGLDGPGEISDVVLTFYAVGRNYVFLRPAQVMAVMDRDAEGEDRAIGLGMSTYRSEAPKFNTVFEESMSVTIPAEALARMAKANALELFVGPIGYRLNENQLSAVREMARLIPEGN